MMIVTFSDTLRIHTWSRIDKSSSLDLELKGVQNHRRWNCMQLVIWTANLTEPIFAESESLRLILDVMNTWVV